MANEEYLQGRADERRKIKGLLELDLLLLEVDTPKELVQRAIDMIDNEPIEIQESASCGPNCACD